MTTAIESANSQVVQRLRTSKSEFLKRVWSEGYEHGREWATSSASYEELLRLAALQFHDGDEYAAQFNRTINPSDYQTESFWQDMSDDGTGPTEEYVAGFVAAAKEVWQEVADKL